MHSTPVGIRCAECAGAPTGVRKVVEQSYRRGKVPITVALIAVTVIMFIAQKLTSTAGAGGTGLSGLYGGVTEKLELFGPYVADGEWWRTFSVALTHGSIVHIAMNMISLWVVGSIVETGLGPIRYLGIYLAATVWGSAGAMFLDPKSAAVGASGGIFGLLAAIAVVQWLRGGRVSGDIIGVLAFNLIFTLSIPGISIGGHLGGILGGALAALAAIGLERRVHQSKRLAVALGAMALVIVVGFGVAMWAADRSLAIVGAG